MSKQSLGAQGEQLVVRILEQRGHQVLKRNWKTRWWEIDLVTQHGSEVWVVEVKARSSGLFGKPEAAVGPGKVRKLLLAAQTLASRLAPNESIKCVVASVCVQPQIRVQFIHIPSS